MAKFKQLYTALCTLDECILKTRLEEYGGGGGYNMPKCHNPTNGHAGVKGKQSDKHAVKMKIEG